MKHIKDFSFKVTAAKLLFYFTKNFERGKIIHLIIILVISFYQAKQQKRCSC